MPLVYKRSPLVVLQVHNNVQKYSVAAGLTLNTLVFALRQFYGVTYIESSYYIVSDYCAKGVLVDILHDDKVSLSKDFKYSMAIELACGMRYLHGKNIVHGHLSSKTCLLDGKWTVKIADWEYTKVFSLTGPNKYPLKYLRKSPDDIGVENVRFMFLVFSLIVV